MKTHRFGLKAATMLASFISLSLGCSDSSSQPTDKSADPTNESAKAYTGYQPVISQQENSPEQQTVAVFLDCLRRGDEATANSMLTSKAREELRKTSYAVQPLGTPEGRFKIGRLGYPYPDKSVALVECQWNEPATTTDPAMVMDIVCEVYKEAEGWRIAGMAITMQGTEDTLVIDFEDGQALQRMLDIANGQTPSQPVQVNQPGQFQQPSGPTGQPEGQTPQQFAQPVQQTNQSAGASLPPLPGYPQAGETQVAQPPAALPVLR